MVGVFYYSFLNDLWRWNSVFRNVDTEFWRRGITQKKEYNINKVAKVRNQEPLNLFFSSEKASALEMFWNDVSIEK